MHLQHIEALVRLEEHVQNVKQMLEERMKSVEYLVEKRMQALEQLIKQSHSAETRRLHYWYSESEKAAKNFIPMIDWAFVQ